VVGSLIQRRMDGLDFERVRRTQVMKEAIRRSHLVLTIAVVFVVLITNGVFSAGAYCTSDADCDDGLFCNGVESCNLSTNTCVAVSACPPSIPPTVCNEITDTCDPVECTYDYHCDDGLFCNGVESCDPGTYTCVAVSACPPSIPPTVCNEITDTCDPVDCTAHFHCDDGLFCNGVESCNLATNTCVAVSACPPSFPPTVCNELTDTCDELIFQDGFESGNTSMWSNSLP
jgi:hypothetical protein